MENILPEAPLEQITLLPQYAEAFKAFCQRNRVPIIPHGDDGRTYLIRAGIDHTDALIMAYKQGWIHGEAADPNMVNLLILEHHNQTPTFDYEFFPCPRDKQDEILLGTYR